MTDKTSFDIRQLPSSDPVNLLLGNYAFSSSPKVPNKEEDEKVLQQRSDDVTLHSFIDGESVAKVGILPMMQNVRGTVMPMGGIGGVCSMPAARRGGHIRALMQQAIERMHNDGQAVSALYPFKSSYYEMFGYAGWQVPMWAHIEPAALAPYMQIPKHGSVTQRLTTDAKDAFYAFMQDAQCRTHGMSQQQRLRFDIGQDRHPTWFMSVHEGEETTGGICYKMDLDKEVMQANAVFWKTTNAMLHVFDFMARHVDQVKTISMPLLDGHDPHLWTTDDFRITVLSNDDQSWGAPMARVVDVAGLAGISVGDARASVTIRDAQAPWNDGVWTLTGENGALVVTKGGEPGGVLTINGFSALVFSGIDPTLLPFRGWGEVDTETAEALKTLFPAVTPYLQELF